MALAASGWRARAFCAIPGVVAIDWAGLPDALGAPCVTSRIGGADGGETARGDANAAKRARGMAEGSLEGPGPLCGVEVDRGQVRGAAVPADAACPLMELSVNVGTTAG